MNNLVDAWLESRPMPPVEFLLRIEPLVPSERRRCFVADQGGALVGLAFVVPVPRRDGWLIEHVVRAHRAPQRYG